MTWKDFVCLNWQTQICWEFADYIYKSLQAESAGRKFLVCATIPTKEYKKTHKYARTIEHYYIDRTLYKTRAKLLEALQTI